MAQDWENYQELLNNLFLHQDMSLKEVKEYMETEHQFTASKSQYETQFKKWGFRKNIKSSEWEIIRQKIEKRKVDGKESQLWVNGIQIPPKKVKREISRYDHPSLNKFSNQGTMPQSPPGVQLKTPPNHKTAKRNNIIEALEKQLSSPVVKREDDLSQQSETETLSRLSDDDYKRARSQNRIVIWDNSNKVARIRSHEDPNLPRYIPNLHNDSPEHVQEEYLLPISAARTRYQPSISHCRCITPYCSKCSCWVCVECYSANIWALSLKCPVCGYEPGYGG